MLWNQLIALVDSTYSVLLISAFLQLNIVDFSNARTKAETFAFSFGFGLTLIVLAYPIVIFWVYNSKMRRSWPDYTRLRQLQNLETTGRVS